MRMISLTCTHCGEPFLRQECLQRFRVKRGEGKRTFCSTTCMAKQNKTDWKLFGIAPPRPQPKPIQFGLEALSDREMQCARFLARSLSYKEVAREMDISPETVKIHARNTYKKLKVKTRADLISFFEDDAEDQTPITPLQISSFDKMKPRDQEIIRLAAIGFSYVEIALRMEVSSGVTKDRLTRLREIVGARNRVALAALWNQYEKHKQEHSDERRRQHADHVSA